MKIDLSKYRELEIGEIRRASDVWETGENVDFMVGQPQSQTHCAVYRPISKLKAKPVPKVKPVEAWAYLYENKIKAVRLDRRELLLYSVPRTKIVRVLISLAPGKEEEVSYAITFFAGVFISFVLTTAYFACDPALICQNDAVAHHAAHYDPQTGAFTWNQ